MVLTLHFWNLVRDHTSYFTDSVLTRCLDFDSLTKLHYLLKHILLFFVLRFRSILGRFECGGIDENDAILSFERHCHLSKGL
jgi:hypothetical protein